MIIRGARFLGCVKGVNQTSTWLVEPVEVAGGCGRGRRMANPYEVKRKELFLDIVNQLIDCFKLTEYRLIQR